MSFDQLLLFISLTFFVSASPGPVMLSCMAYAGRYGLGASGYLMLGASAGNLVLMLLSALGIGLLAEQAHHLFLWIQWLGAIYLIYMGLQLLFTASAASLPNAPQAVSRHLLTRGFIIALTNPKGLLYFGALFPVFIQPTKAMVPQFTLLTIIFLSMDLVWMLIYAKGGNVLMQWLDKPAHQRWFNRASGGLLIIAGIFMGFAEL